MIDTGKEVTLRFIAPSEALLGDTLVQEALHPMLGATLKARVLSRLGIEPRDGEGELAAWMRVMAEENGLPASTPCDRALLDAIEGLGAMRFVMFLA